MMMGEVRALSFIGNSSGLARRVDAGRCGLAAG
ncbi:Uncharacterised protein [Lelliottia amnigena]|nr:Uncharacterised protein [Lelliottia amnigena]